MMIIFPTIFNVRNYVSMYQKIDFLLLSASNILNFNFSFLTDTLLSFLQKNKLASFYGPQCSSCRYQLADKKGQQN